MMTEHACGECGEGEKVFREPLVQWLITFLVFGSLSAFSIRWDVVHGFPNHGAMTAIAKGLLYAFSVVVGAAVYLSITTPRLIYWMDGEGSIHEHLTLPRCERVTRSDGTIEREEFFDDQGQLINEPILSIHPTIRRQVRVFNGGAVPGEYGTWHIGKGRNGSVKLGNGLSGTQAIKLTLPVREAIPFLALRMRLSQMVHTLKGQTDAEKSFRVLGLSMMAVAAWIDLSSSRTQSKIGEHCRLMLEEALLDIPDKLRQDWSQFVQHRLGQLERATIGKHRHERSGPV